MRRTATICVLLAAVVANLSCSRAVRIAPSDYVALENEAAGYLVFTAADGTYRATELHVAGDDLVITSLSDGDPRWKQITLPISIALDQVVYIETRVFQPVKTIAAIAGPALFVYGLLWLSYR